MKNYLIEACNNVDEIIDTIVLRNAEEETAKAKYNEVLAELRREGWRPCTEVDEEMEFGISDRDFERYGATITLDEVYFDPDDPDEIEDEKTIETENVINFNQLP